MIKVETNELESLDVHMCPTQKPHNGCILPKHIIKYYGD